MTDVSMDAEDKTISIPGRKEDINPLSSARRHRQAHEPTQTEGEDDT